MSWEYFAVGCALIVFFGSGAVLAGVVLWRVLRSGSPRLAVRPAAPERAAVATLRSLTVPTLEDLVADYDRRIVALAVAASDQERLAARMTKLFGADVPKAP